MRQHASPVLPRAAGVMERRPAHIVSRVHFHTVREEQSYNAYIPILSSNMHACQAFKKKRSEKKFATPTFPFLAAICMPAQAF
jgi:hypothetical protein